MNSSGRMLKTLNRMMTLQQISLGKLVHQNAPRCWESRYYPSRCLWKLIIYTSGNSTPGLITISKINMRFFFFYQKPVQRDITYNSLRTECPSTLEWMDKMWLAFLYDNHTTNNKTEKFIITQYLVQRRKNKTKSQMPKSITYVIQFA